MPDVLTRRVPGAAAALADAAPDAGLRSVWTTLGTAGVLAALYRRRDGLELIPGRLRDLLAAVDERGRTGVTLGVCVQVATAIPLLAEGSATPVANTLATAMNGLSVTALAATDADAAGSDLSALRTHVEIGGERLTLNGRKRWITNATTCDQFLVLARHRPGRHFTSFTWVLVPRDTPGVLIRPADTRFFQGAGLGDVDFRDISLPASHLAGRPGRGMASFARHITGERLAGAVWAAALCRRVLRDAHTRLRDGDRRDQPLWSHQELRHRLAGAIVEVRQLEALTRELEHGIVTGYDPAAAAAVKVAAARVTARVLETCASMAGADGYLTGRTSELRAEAALFGIGGGTTDLMLDVIADHATELLSGERP